MTNKMLPLPVKEIQTREHVPSGPIRIRATGKIKLVILESPLAPCDGRTFEDNKAYARKCMRDSLKKNESPFASHLLFDQAGILDDMVPEERELGIEAGLAWGRGADGTVVYIDHGISDGMKRGIARARAEGRPVEFRKFDGGDVAKTVTP